MARDPYKYFRIEARDLLDQLSQAVLELEKVTTTERVAQLLRLAHTLKGAARVVKRPDIGDLAHEIENILEPLRGAEQQATQPVINAILAHLDDMNARVASLSSTQSENPVDESTSTTPPLSIDHMSAAEEATPAKDAPTVTHVSTPPIEAAESPVSNKVTEVIRRTVRVDVDEMDRLLDGFTELHVQLSRLREELKQANDIQNQVDLLNKQIADHGDVLSTRTVEYGQIQTLVDQLGLDVDRLTRNLDLGVAHFDRELRQVHDAAERMRLIRADSLFVFLERVVRDAAQVQSKKVVFQGYGGDVRLDAQVLGAVQDALSHVVRNAVVHGIESPTDRQAAGKSSEGHVVIEVAQQDRWIVFTCRDDGCGIDLDAIRQVAIQRNILTEQQAQSITSNDLLQLLLKGGISTSEDVTKVSGRGVGLDVLRDTAKRLDGTIDIQTNADQGTRINLTVPLLIASLDGLLVESSGVVATLPITAVSSTLRILPEDIAHTAQGETIIFDGQSIPFISLSNVLAPNTSQTQRHNRIWAGVVIEADTGAAAIGVDRLLGVSNMVLRPVPELAFAKSIVSAVSLNAEGNPQLVLNPAHLIIEAQGADINWDTLEEIQHTILIIDDSLTTRMLERSILESAGYNVELATSGEEGLEKAAQNPYDLFLVDVEMPGIDGFTFIERIQSNPDLRHIPAILVTSRASPEDLQRGRDVGARDYVIKSEFNQGALLARIKELVR